MTDINTQDADIQQPQQPNADPAETGENKGKLFTQDEVNRIVSERLNREREKAAQTAAQAAETAPDDEYSPAQGGAYRGREPHQMQGIPA